MFMTAIICSNRIGGMNWIWETLIQFKPVTEEENASSLNEILAIFCCPSYTYSTYSVYALSQAKCSVLYTTYLLQNTTL